MGVYQMKHDSTLYNAMAAIASARTMDEALEALELAEQLVAVAYTARVR